MIWLSTEPVYNDVTDTIDLVAADGDVMAKLPRDTIIKMLDMFPSEPPLTGQENRQILKENSNG